MTDPPLFRPEAAAARQQRLEGEILLMQPVRTQALVLLLCAIVGAAGLWLALGSYARSETARGILVTREPSAKVVALRPGQLVRLLVREGTGSLSASRSLWCVPSRRACRAKARSPRASARSPSSAGAPGSR